MDDSVTNTWLPTTEQLIMASQRAILASLDANLVLAARALQAEHIDELSNEDRDQPCPPHLALTKSILIITDCLRDLIANYAIVVDQMLGDG